MESFQIPGWGAGGGGRVRKFVLLRVQGAFPVKNEYNESYMNHESCIELKEAIFT